MTVEYRSLDELMAGKAPGSLTVEEFAGTKRVFQPYFKINDAWWGIVNNKWGDSAKATDPVWRPHVPPPKKVKRWRWRIEPTKPGGIPRESYQFYTDEDEARDHECLCSDAWTFHRLDETEREFSF